MKKIHYILVFIFLSACASVGKMDRAGTGTSVNLNHKNYRVLKQAAIGRDTGFWLLFIPILPLHTVMPCRIYIQK